MANTHIFNPIFLFGFVPQSVIGTPWKYLRFVNGTQKVGIRGYRAKWRLCLWHGHYLINQKLATVSDPADYGLWWLVTHIRKWKPSDFDQHFYQFGDQTAVTANTNYNIFIDTWKLKHSKLRAEDQLLATNAAHNRRELTVLSCPHRSPKSRPHNGNPHSAGPIQNPCSLLSAGLLRTPSKDIVPISLVQHQLNRASSGHW